MSKKNAIISNEEEYVVENLKMFWRYIKLNRKGVNTVPSTLAYEGKLAESNDETCNIDTLERSLIYLVTTYCCLVYLSTITCFLHPQF